MKPTKFDGSVKSRRVVTPANAGVHKCLIKLDPGFHRDDTKRQFLTFYRSIKFVASFFALLLLQWTGSGTVFADAATAQQEINAAYQHIETSVAVIDQLAQEKKLGEALVKLTELNTYIDDNLVPVFYDKIIQVRREIPDYTPPVLAVNLGPYFITSYWDGKIQQAESTHKEAIEALEGVAAMRKLNSQDSAFAYLKTAYDTFSSLKDVVEDIVSVNFVKLAWDFHEGANTFIDNYKAIEAAKLAGLETDSFKSLIKTLARRAEITLELMQDLKSALIVYRSDVLNFQYHLQNIQNFTTRATHDPVFPLDFSNTLYNFDITPYITAVDSLKANFENGDFCWQFFDTVYQQIHQEAASQRQKIDANINGSAEPESNKQVYLNDVSLNWNFFDAHASNIHTGFFNARVDVLATYNTLIQTVDTLGAQRDAIVAAYWDKSGFVRQDLRTFQEEDHEIVQVNLPDIARPGPYYLAREYAPYFPTSPLASSYQMQVQTPDIENFPFEVYAEGLFKLAGAYRNMAESALQQDSTRTYGDGSPVAHFGLSPLSQDLMNDVAYNLNRVRDQALDFETFMNNKASLIPDAFEKQAQLETALAALVAYVDSNQGYLCLDGTSIHNDAVSQWDTLVAPMLASDWNYSDGVDGAIGAIDNHLAYIEGQNEFNDDLKDAGDLIQSLDNNRMLLNLIMFIVNDFATLPDFPSEQGYRDFLTELDYLHAFYGLANLDSVMNLRATARSLFANLYGGGRWFSQFNSYCVMPETVEKLQQLISEMDTWADLYIPNVRQGFPGWDAWGRNQLNTYWPTENTEEIRPNVTHFTPGRNSEAVSVYQALRISFNEAIDVETLTDTSVLFEANGNVRSRRMAYDPAEKRLMIYPARMLPSTRYTVSLTDEVTDLSGNGLVPESWSFTTEVVSSAAWVSIDITGVEEGATYADPVTIGISVSAGTYRAELSINGEAPQPVTDGHVVSRRGRYQLTVIADQGLTRTIEFVVGTDTEDYQLNVANAVETDVRPFVVGASSTVAVGKRYFVDGNRYIYNIGGKVYLYDLLTAENKLLFDTGFYYQTEGGVNVESSTYCSFLGVSGDHILYCKSTGAEGPGVSPDSKTFQLFVFDLNSGKSEPVPLPPTITQISGFISAGQVVWSGDYTGTPSLFAWEIGDSTATTLLELSGLDTWQTPEIMGFDGEWVLYRIGDGGAYNYQGLDGNFGYDLREPKGESLHGLHIPTGENSVLIPWDSAAPSRVAYADVHAGVAAFMVYRMHGEVVSTEFGDTWEDTCDASGLYLRPLFSDQVMTVSQQPQIGDGQRFMLSDSLLYWVNRNTAAPFSISASTTTSQLTHNSLDLISNRVFGVDLGIFAWDYQLFGDRMITDDPAAKVITFGKPVSTVGVANKVPAPDTADVALDSTVTVTFSDAMAAETLTSEWISMSRVDGEGGFLDQVPLKIQYDPGSFTLTLSPEGLVSGARYRVYIAGQVEDAVGNAFVQPVVWYFTTEDITGPELLSSVPGNGSTVLSPGTSITLRFDEKVNSDTVTAGILLLQGETAVGFTSNSGDDGTLMITPAAPLAYDTSYTIEGTAALTDMAGNPLVQPFTISFETIGETVSAAGGTILYGDSMMGSITRVDADGQNSGLVAMTSVASIRWQPSGERIFVATQNQDLQVMNPDGTGVTSVASGLPYNFIPDFSPDGTRILYAAQREGLWGYNLVSNSLDGSDPVTLYAVEQDSIGSVAWSPDGERIAFVWNHGATPPELGVLTVATGEIVFREDLVCPVWAPDSSRLYAHGRVRENNFEKSMVAISPDLTQAEPIFPLAEIQAAAISPSGSHLALYLSNGIHLVDLVNRTIDQRLACSPAAMGPVQLFWSRDETEILFNAMGVADAWSPGVFALDIANRRVATIAMFGGMPAAPMDWLPLVSAALPPLVTAGVTDLSTDSEVNVRIDWSEYSRPAEVSAFRLYRGLEPFSQVSGLTPLIETAALTYTDLTADRGIPYYYAVTAVTTSGLEHSLVVPFGPTTPGDNDGLEDVWEQHYFGHLDSLPGGDPDNDGLTNLEEMREQTNPNLPDSDGDLAPDGLEIARAMNPLVADVQPLQVSAPMSEVEIGSPVPLSAAGGSGSYAWTISDASLAQVDTAGNFSGLMPGTVTVVLEDQLFPGLSSQPLQLNVVQHTFNLLPGSPLVLQKDGRLTIEAVGGSGLYGWEISDNQTAAMDGYGSSRTVTPLLAAGTFQVIVADLVRTDLDPIAIDISIETIPGDISGDSRVTLEDTAILLQLLARMPVASDIVPHADVNADQKLGFEEAVYTLEKIAGIR